MNLKILYEDNHLIAVVKPAGVLSQPTHKATAWRGQGDLPAQAGKTGDVSIFDEVKAYLKEKYHKPGNAFLGLLHRLDRPVSGIMLFAKTSKGASRLSEQFRNQTIEKIYHAIVAGKPLKVRGMLVNKIQKSKGKSQNFNPKFKSIENNKTGQEAVLYYEIIKSIGSYSLLKIKIEGGKFHQIRAQLSLAGFPILGDVKYGSKTALPNEAIALCATGLSFYPATSNEMVKLSIKVPEEWNSYI